MKLDGPAIEANANYRVTVDSFLAGEIYLAMGERSLVPQPDGFRWHPGADPKLGLHFVQCE